MKILMFGWEFPPRISGGLGPACEGIVNALDEQGVAVTFVVPKLFGEEKTNATLIDAGTVDVSPDQRAPAIPPTPYAIVSETVVDVADARISRWEKRDAMRVPSSPYETETHYTIEAWEEAVETLTAYVESLKVKNVKAAVQHVQDVRTPHHLTFTGSYGQDLMDEVLRYACVAARLAAQRSFDLIHVHDWITIPAGLAAKDVSGQKLVVHIHSTAFDRSLAGIDPVIFDIEKRGLQGADKIIAVSEWTKHMIVKHYDISPHKIDVVHNGVRALKSIANLPTRVFYPPVVTFLGRITSQKGPLYFVQAAAKVLSRFPQVHFVMAGTGDMREAVIEETARRQISSNFHFPGFVSGDTVAKLWSMTDVYVMPSVSEPFGITPLEAVQAGVPVIISKQSGVSEVLEHAIKVDFWDADALAEAICAVITHTSLAKTLSENAKRVITQLNWQEAGVKIKTIYHQLYEAALHHANIQQHT